MLLCILPLYDDDGAMGARDCLNSMCSWVSVFTELGWHPSFIYLLPVVLGLKMNIDNIEKILQEEPSRLYTYRTQSADKVSIICVSALDSAARSSERGSLCTEQSLLQATGVST